jgi:hypothetical protein
MHGVLEDERVMIGMMGQAFLLMHLNFAIQSEEGDKVVGKGR